MNDELNQIKIASPCTADWGKMSGDERARFCGACKKNVYNLSAMTAKEATDLIKRKEGKLCVAFYRRADGTVLTTDCPVGVEEHLKRMWWKATAMTASLIAMILLVGCKKKPSAQCAPLETGRVMIKGGVTAHQNPQ